MPRPSITLTFDRLTLKLICESRPRLGTFIPPNVGTLGLWVLELFSMYATDEQTDRLTDRRRRTNKSNAHCPLFYTVGGITSVRRELCVELFLIVDC